MDLHKEAVNYRHNSVMDEFALHLLSWVYPNSSVPLRVNQIVIK